MKTLNEEVPQEYKDRVQERIYNELPDKAAFEDLDVVQPSVSAPIGDKKNAGHKAHEPSNLKKKRSSKSDKFTTIVTKFIGI